MANQILLTDIDGAGTAWVTLNRPAVHNAFDEALIAALTDAFRRLGADAGVRAVVLRGAGKSFSAGGDLNWMKRSAAYSEAENVRDAERLAAMLDALNRLPRPTIALVHGAAMGGGVGLVAACDMAIAAEGAVFSLSEVRLGLLPAVIAPYVLAAIGSRQARRYFLSAERIGATEARQIGLVHEVVAPAALEARGRALLAVLANNSPEAMAAAKDLIAAIAGRPIDGKVRRETARRIAEARASAEGREGIAAFLEKRRPAWMKD